MDAMRGFIFQYPHWEKWGVKPAGGWFFDYRDISVDWFMSGSAAQLALQLTGSNIIRTGSDPVWKTYIDGTTEITRQMNFMLNILQNSESSSQRADNNEFLLDFIEWLDLMNVMRKAPVFGDDPQAERTWATNGGFLSYWEDKQSLSVYVIQLHKVYITRYDPIFE